MWHYFAGLIKICPGFIRTPIAKAALTSSGREFAKEDPDLSKGTSVVDCAETILAAASSGNNTTYFGSCE